MIDLLDLTKKTNTFSFYTVFSFIFVDASKCGSRRLHNTKVQRPLHTIAVQ